MNEKTLKSKNQVLKFLRAVKRTLIAVCCIVLALILLLLQGIYYHRLKPTVLFEDTSYLGYTVELRELGNRLSFLPSLTWHTFELYVNDKLCVKFEYSGYGDKGLWPAEKIACTKDDKEAYVLSLLPENHEQLTKLPGLTLHPHFNELRSCYGVFEIYTYNDVKYDGSHRFMT